MSPAPSPATCQKRRENSIASSLDLASTSAKPTTASFASVNGPSVRLTLPPEEITCVGLAPSPPVASRTPALDISSISLPMAAYISGLGGVVGWFGSFLVIIIYLIFYLL